MSTISSRWQVPEVQRWVRRSVTSNDDENDIIAASTQNSIHLVMLVVSRGITPHYRVRKLVC